jgi:hypothetical protein
MRAIPISFTKPLLFTLYEERTGIPPSMALTYPEMWFTVAKK